VARQGYLFEDAPRRREPPPVPYVAGSETSKGAAESMAPHASRLAEEVFAYVLGREDGATVDEVEEALGMLHQTAGARMRELVKAGRVADSGAKRPTRSGRKAVVWRAV
jgi:predicted ArsR family transcriptional regulator